MASGLMKLIGRLTMAGESKFRRLQLQIRGACSGTLLENKVFVEER